jgi:hypothetical protein
VVAHIKNVTILVDRCGLPLKKTTPKDITRVAAKRLLVTPRHDLMMRRASVRLSDNKEPEAVIRSLSYGASTQDIEGSRNQQ